MEVLKIRKATETPGETMWQTGRVGLFMALLIFVLWPAIARTVEKRQDLSDSVIADFQFVADASDWHVLYRAVAARPVHAHFTLQTRTTDDQVVCSYRSTKSYPYSPNLSVRKPWSWDSWAESSDPLSCGRPSAPFRICLRYDGVTRLGNAFDTPFTCKDFTQTTSEVPL
ncbi:hypothetical protein SAMN04488005_1498 [Yoonia tamlensis]|uniref:Uncharacterized protein n=1 Tax=Yoonia tamlensis TaxID=390270 RepID=A0A1I6GE58_9RHOB|nr:hypothetical protein [Yoonia tamlensis]SFR40430.1 hypothetical protein SAMN04488005_1498 [Yoonia tamlensis]